ncbi:AI-2E family transporter [Planktothricoides sp. SR001]|uniref:AI-2E family transporter n=1 Tax=Planktothricoides sp. SR001 TaxID=1705388 RepID=UPI00092E8E23|nr:AI-2E family transporter [Planktothricoides sp. SR001]
MNLGQSIGLLVFILSFYILWQIRQILLLVFAAVILATALNRFARFLQQWKNLKRSWAVFLSISFLVFIFTIVVLIIVPPFVVEFQQLTNRFPQGINKGIQTLNDWVNQLEYRFSGELGQRVLDLFKIEDIIRQVQNLINQIAEGLGAFLGGTVGFVGGTVGVFLSFLLVMILSIMILAEPLAYRRAFVRLFPSFYRRRVEYILDRCDVALGGWLVGILLNMTAITVLSWIGLSILGVRLALAHAVLAGLLTFIPNIGPGLSVLPPIVIAVLDDPWKSLAVLILYILIQQAESNFLTPFVMAQQVSLLPAITLLAQLFFATFFGFLGLFLALPLTVVAQVWVQEILMKDVLDKWDKKLENISENMANLNQISQFLDPEPAICLVSANPPPEILETSENTDITPTNSPSGAVTPQENLENAVENIPASEDVSEASENSPQA